MLLRRITEHVKAQNWTAVALDFVIVVVGVFIGIQVSNWNDARQEASLEEDFLANIIVDLRSDARDLQSAIDLAEVNIRAATYALDRAGLKPASVVELSVENALVPGMRFDVPAPGELSEQETRRLWSLSVVRYHAVPSSTAFDTLMATGRLDLISEDELISKLQAYRARWSDIETSQNTTFRPFRNQVIFVGQKHGLSPFIEMPEAEFVALLRDSPELAGALRTMMEYAVLHRDQLSATRQTTLALLQSLGAEEE